MGRVLYSRDLRFAYPRKYWIARLAGAPTASLSSAVLVCSELYPGGPHAPCLDLAVPATVTQAPLPVLWLDLPLSEWRYRLLLWELSSLGICAGARRVPFSPSRRLGLYEVARRAARDDSVFWETFSVLSVEWSGSLESLLDLTVDLVGYGSVLAPAMSSPWPFPLAVPVHLAPSGESSLRSLLVERPVGPSRYLRLLRSLERTGVLSPPPGRAFPGVSHVEVPVWPPLSPVTPVGALRVR